MSQDLKLEGFHSPVISPGHLIWSSFLFLGNAEKIFVGSKVYDDRTRSKLPSQKAQLGLCSAGSYNGLYYCVIPCEISHWHAFSACNYFCFLVQLYDKTHQR